MQKFICNMCEKPMDIDTREDGEVLICAGKPKNFIKPISFKLTVLDKMVDNVEEGVDICTTCIYKMFEQGIIHYNKQKA